MLNISISLKKLVHFVLVFIYLCATPLSAIATNDVRTINLNPNFGFPVRLPENAATIAIGDPNLIDIVTVEPNLLMVTGQRVGATSLTIFGKSGAIYQYRVQVTSDVTQLRNMIQSIEPHVSVDDINGKVILRGEVKTPAALSRILTVADRFFGGAGQPDFKVVSDQGGILAGNLDDSIRQTLGPLAMTTGGGRNGGGGGGRGGQNQTLDSKANLAQNISRASVISVANGRVLSLIKVTTQPKVEIQMRIVEVDRSKTDKFGINWRLDGNNVSVGSFVGDTTASLPAPGDSAPISRGAADLIGFFQPGKYVLSTFVKALEEKGATSTLSEPLLTAISGESARFMVGGTVPIPFQELNAGGNGQNAVVATNIRYETFGLNITVQPTVLENGKISIVLDQQMSEIDYSNAIQIIGSQVPGFKQKTVSTITESESGETWAVAGLLTEEDRKNLQSVPWISKVPILGKLFENKDDSVSRNEIIILVNARRVDKPNTTTTSFDGKGKLEPRSTEMTYGDNLELNGELNSHNISPINQAPATNSPTTDGVIPLNNPTMPKGTVVPTKPSENKPSENLPNTQKNKLIKDKNKFKLPASADSSEKVVFENTEKGELNSQLEVSQIRIIKLREKEVAMVENNRQTAYALENKLFSFDPAKIINTITQEPATLNENIADQNVNQQTAVSEIEANVKENNQPIVSKSEPENNVSTPALNTVNQKVNPSKIAVIKLDKIDSLGSTNNHLAGEHTPEKIIVEANQQNLAQANFVKVASNTTENTTESHVIKGSLNNLENKILSDKSLNQAEKFSGVHTFTNLRGEDIKLLDLNLPFQKVAQKDLTYVEPVIANYVVDGKLKLNVIHFLAGEEKLAFFKELELKDKLKLLGNKDFSTWKVAVGSVVGDESKLIKFLISPSLKTKVFSGTVVTIDNPQQQLQYAVDY